MMTGYNRETRESTCYSEVLIACNYSLTNSVLTHNDKIPLLVKECLTSKNMKTTTSTKHLTSIVYYSPHQHIYKMVIKRFNTYSRRTRLPLNELLTCNSNDN